MTYRNVETNFFFSRCDEMVKLDDDFADTAGLVPGMYRVVSQAIMDIAGPFPTIVGYVVLHEGKLFRSWYC